MTITAAVTSWCSENSLFASATPLIISSIEAVDELGITTAKLTKQTDYNKRIQALLLYVNELIEAHKINVDKSKGFIYLSEFLIKTFSFETYDS